MQQGCSFAPETKCECVLLCGMFTFNLAHGGQCWGTLRLGTTVALRCNLSLKSEMLG